MKTILQAPTHHTASSNHRANRLARCFGCNSPESTPWYSVQGKLAKAEDILNLGHFPAVMRSQYWYQYKTGSGRTQAIVDRNVGILEPFDFWAPAGLTLLVTVITPGGS